MTLELIYVHFILCRVHIFNIGRCAEKSKRILTGFSGEWHVKVVSST
jgi:hypothetical protein